MGIHVRMDILRTLFTLNSHIVDLIVYTLLTRCTHFSEDPYKLILSECIWCKSVAHSVPTVCLLFHLTICQ